MNSLRFSAADKEQVGSRKGKRWCGRGVRGKEEMSLEVVKVGLEEEDEA